MKFSPLVDRIKGESVAAWTIHGRAREAQLRGEDVIVLSIGDPEMDLPAPVLDRAIETLRQGDVRYTPAAGRPALRAAIAQLHQRRTGQAATAENVIFLSGAQNALYAASMCVAGPGDEVMALEPLYPSYPATIRASGATLVRVPAPAACGFRPDLNAFEAAITPKTRALFFASPNNPSGVILSAELSPPRRPIAVIAHFSFVGPPSSSHLWNNFHAKLSSETASNVSPASVTASTPAPVRFLQSSFPLSALTA